MEKNQLKLYSDKNWGEERASWGKKITECLLPELCV